MREANESSECEEMANPGRSDLRYDGREKPMAGPVVRHLANSPFSGKSKDDIVVRLQNIGLKFTSYHDSHPSLKRALLNLVLRRSAPAKDKTFWALREIDLTIRQGERVALVGTNGAGKSTLLKVIARIYEPSVGRMTVRGRIAPMIEMGAGFHPELTGRRNIQLNGSLLGMSRAEMAEREPAIWNWTGLAEFADLPLKYYSSGMFQRLAFAIATEVNPEILLVDESLNAGDASFVDKAKRRILDVFDKAKAVVVVSHDLSLVAELCDRTVWLDHGRIMADGPTTEILERYVKAVRAA
jgi:ABC-type polysaccharide/polyol phosphate transport system ATPase subunit